MSVRTLFCYRTTMKSLGTFTLVIGIVLLVLSVRAERSKRSPQSWRDGLWGRELELRKRQRLYTEPSDLLEDVEPQQEYKNQVGVNKMAYPEFIGSEKNDLGLSRLQNRNDEE